MNASQRNGKNGIDGESYFHSVCRSKELLSCAKTAWKIQQQKHEQLDPTSKPAPIPNLQLASNDFPPISLKVLEDGLTLLRAMDFGLKELQKLVRRRGHTNDPTTEIATLVKQLEQDTEELTEFCKQVLAKYSRRRKQEKRHWELVVQWFQQIANQYSNQLQECLKIRGEVLADQAQQRKKLVDTSKKKSNPMRSKATPLFDSPLFQQTPIKSTATSKQQQQQQQPLPPPQTKHYSQTNGRTPSSGFPSKPNHNNIYQRKTTTAKTNQSSSYYGNVGAGYGGTTGYDAVGYGGSSAAYGGGGATYSSTGMRQRKASSMPSYPSSISSSSSSSAIDYQQQEEEKIHFQIQQRQQQRETQQRLDEAQQAESMLGELGQLFGKMSSLIVQQGETLEKIEDDVEAAHADIMAGQEEITKLYHIKKGNRPLIIKTFAILIFLIIFMRAYKK